MEQSEPAPLFICILYKPQELNCPNAPFLSLCVSVYKYRPPSHPVFDRFPALFAGREQSIGSTSACIFSLLHRKCALFSLGIRPVSHHAGRTLSLASARHGSGRLADGKSLDQPGLHAAALCHRAGWHRVNVFFFSKLMSLMFQQKPVHRPPAPRM